MLNCQYKILAADFFFFLHISGPVGDGLQILAKSKLKIIEIYYTKSLPLRSTL